MVRQSKFKIGDKVTMIGNPNNYYEVLLIFRNELKVLSLADGEEFNCKKSLFAKN